ncbi:MAG: hypothetical protein NTZ85_05460 [Bacteroidia bacterium]|nr:hypothetical protein [Bacteroidia bacterium]
MKKADEQQETKRNFNNFLLGLSENAILDFNEMMRVRGGDADGNGSEPIITPPPPPH